ncbi:MAG: methyltransferase [Verrucomicrobiota bacterium]
MDWDLRYKNGDTPWDKGSASPALREIQKKVSFNGSVWVPGAGIGHDARLIAEEFPDSEVSAFEISETAIHRATELGLPDNLKFFFADIFALDPGKCCDVWFEHTCFCAIYPEQREAYENAANTHLKPGGIFVGVFFIGTDFDPEQGPPYFSTETEVKGLFSKNFSLIDEWSPASCYPGREGQEKVYLFRKTG